jgi:hypothetical protein
MGNYLYSLTIKPYDTGTLNQAILDTVIANQAVLEPYLIVLIASDDTQYSIVQQSLNADRCKVEGEGVSVAVSFLSNYFAACRGVDSTDRHSHNLSFRLQNNVLFFGDFIPLRWNIEN